MTQKRFSDIGTPEMHAKHEMEMVKTDSGRTCARRMDGWAPDVMLARGTLSQDEHNSAVRLYNDWFYGVDKNVACHTRPEIKTPEHFDLEGRLDAWDRYKAAMDSLKSEKIEIVVRTVCIDGMSLIEAGKRTHCKREQASVRLHDGLEIIGKHYEEK